MFHVKHITVPFGFTLVPQGLIFPAYFAENKLYNCPNLEDL
jgi:hypothetical protein